MAKKDILKQIGENTAYSAKTHLNASDLRRRTTIVFLVSISIILVSDLFFNPLFIKILGIVALTFSVLLLIIQAQDGKNSHVLHKQIGEKYFKLHYDIFEAFNQKDISEKEVTKLKDRMNELNSSEKPPITFFAKKMATRAIEKKGEMNIWWK